MVSFDPAHILQVLPKLLTYLPVTLAVVGITVLLGTLLGGIVAWGLLASDNYLRKIAESYVFVLRCTPPIVLLFIVFYGFPRFLNWWLGIQSDRWSRGVFVIIAMTLLFAAIISKVFTSAYLSVPKGQLEAGLSIGLSPFQTFYRILLPQAARIALPNFSTALLNLMKDAALAYTIGLIDVLGGANLLINRNFGNFSLETYTAAAIIYWGLAFVLTLATQAAEHLLTPKGY
ncbi:amino acid ABC transporter permease [Enterococcus sp. AZ072]|uniref:amino acid ABC transporter permease n=1 Tax=unclassified Enterococcus TaxID=2608891 RepID=UPI003D2CD758